MFAQVEITFTTSDFNGYNISCFGAKDGSITANVSGGTPPYTYQWSNEQTTATITGLSADFYNVVVTDSSGESADFGINLTAPELLKPILAVYQYNNGYNVSLYGASNGSITTTIDGGVSPFTFQWEDGPVTQNRSQLGGGFYVLQVTDANNCASVAQTSLSEPERDDWTMGGNANTNPASNFIGTTDNKDLVFKTNGQERMRLGATGLTGFKGIILMDTLRVNRIMPQDGDSLLRFGFGTLWYDTYRNNIYATASSTYYQGLGIGTGCMAHANLSVALGYLAQTSGVKSIAIGNRVGSSGNNSIVIGSGYGASQLINSVDNSLMVGFNSELPTLIVSPAPAGVNQTGNLGIGTTGIPVFKLHVNGDAEFLADDNPTDGLQIVKGVAPKRRGIRLDDDPAGNFDFYINKWQTNAAFNFLGRLGDNGQDENFLTIRKDGKVGIGISNASTWDGAYKLYVVGGIRTEKIKVDLPSVGWGDNVFDENYQLPSLVEIERYIKIHRHLMKIPSAKELKNSGLDVGEMQARQMEKIEELTLYIIQLKKEIESLKSNISK